MKLSAEIKKYFKNLGIPVRTRTVAVKNPFVQVWITPINSASYGNEPLQYNHQFPENLRRNLLAVIYGDEWITKQKSQGMSDCNAGNVRGHSISVSEKEWRALMIKMYNDNKELSKKREFKFEMD